MGRSGRNLINGRSMQVTNIRQLADRINDLRSDLAGKAATDVLRGAAQVVAEDARGLASSQGWPKEAVASIFSFADPQARDKKGKLTALAGVNKRRTKREWTATDHPKSPRAKVGAGRKVAMSLAAMFELGTTRMEPRPAFRTAVANARNRVRQIIADGFLKILEKHAK